MGRGLRPGEAAEFFPFHLAQGEGAFLRATRVSHDPRSNLVRESSSLPPLYVKSFTGQDTSWELNKGAAARSATSQPMCHSGNVPIRRRAG